MKITKNFAFTATVSILSCSIFSAGSFAFSPAVPSLTNSTPSHSLVYKAAIDDKKLVNAQTYVDDLATSAIGFLSDQSLTYEQRKAEFSTLLDQRFDMKAIARFAMGRYWRAATKEQRADYFKLFHTMVLEVYSRRFSEYAGQSIQVTNARAEGEKDVLVSSLIKDESGGPDIRLDWRLRYKDGQFKVIDVIVEGVSMALTQRSEFASVIQRGGGEVGVLLAHLEGQE